VTIDDDVVLGALDEGDVGLACNVAVEPIVFDVSVAGSMPSPLAIPLVIGAEILLTAACAWLLFALLQRPWQVRSKAYIDPQFDIRESGT